MSVDSASINLTNHFLIAMPGLEDDTFAKSVIYLCEHNAQGAMGLTLTVPLDLDLHDLLTQMKIDQVNPELAAHNEAVLRKRLEALQPDTVARRLRRALEQCLPNGEPSAEALAHGLHLSLRSLQRHLSEEGSSYEQVLAETRHALAVQHLGEADCSISEVAYLLGFADSSSFSRAFKRWSGQSPSQYRDSLRQVL